MKEVVMVESLVGLLFLVVHTTSRCRFFLIGCVYEEAKHYVDDDYGYDRRVQNRVLVVVSKYA